MEPGEFAGRYPTLFHLTSPSAVPAIRRHGLLRTATLLNLAGIATADELAQVYELRRKGRHKLDVPEIGTVELRDQQPLHPAGLRRALGGCMAPQDWVNLLNDRVYFWTSRERAHALQHAAGARKYPAHLLELRTEPLLRHYSDWVELTTFNVGYSMRNAKPRDRTSFIPLAQYPSRQWARIHEVTLRADVVDLERFLS